MNRLVARTLIALAATLGACEKKAPPANPAPAPGNTGDGHDHDHDHDHDKGHGGKVIALGTITVNGLALIATRDEGTIVAGKDAPIDVTITAPAGSTTKVVAVRFWIGTEDAKGSVKAKADVENAAEPNRWHTHAEVPDPLVAGSKLWVEIEDDKGAKAVASFELKM